MAWHRVSKAPQGAGTRAWLGQDDAGRTALLREVPQGVTVTVELGATPGIVWLREVVVIDGVRMSVWDLVDAPSLGELTDLAVSRGRPPSLAVLVRIIIDAATALARVRPPRPHGGLSDDVLLVDESGQTHVMDFGLPRPSRFSPPGPPSSRQDAATLAAILRSAAPASKEAVPAGFDAMLSTGFDDVTGLARALASAVPPAMPHEVADFVRSCRSGRVILNETRDDLPAKFVPIPLGTVPGAPPPEAFAAKPKSSSESTEPRAADPAFADTVMRSRGELVKEPPSGSDEPFGVERTVAMSRDFDSDAPQTVFAGAAFRPPDQPAARGDETVAQRPNRVNPASLPDFNEDSGAFVVSDRTVAMPMDPASARRPPPPPAPPPPVAESVPARKPPPVVPLGASDEELEPDGKPPTRRARPESASRRRPAPTSQGPTRALAVVAAILVCLAVGLGVLVWKRARLETKPRPVTPIRVDDSAITMTAPTLLPVDLDGGAPGAEPDVIAEEDDEDAGLDETDDGGEPTSVDTVEDAGVTDSTQKAPLKKKKKKKRRK